MKIIILNSNQYSSNINFEKYAFTFVEKISKNNQVEVLNLKDLDIKYCTGCWSCWVKTCGECITKDDSHMICQKVINSDFVILISSLSMGFVNYQTKKVMDKMIPLLLPYIDVVNEECHHKKRYLNYPKWGVIIEKEQDTDDEDLSICKNIFDRFTINFRSELSFFYTTEKNQEEIINELSNI